VTEVPRILIVDDDDTFRTRLGRAFSERGYHVELAGDAHTALDVARAQPPELAVVDLRMEGPSGLELLKQLRGLRDDIRVVILTGFGSIATAVEAMRLGAINYVAKPADVDDILAAFQKADRPLEAVSDSFRPPSLARMEWEFINRVLVDCGGNVSEAARRLGMHRRTLQRKLAKYPPSDAVR
jgi:two-component system response regulator RegA